MQRCQSSTAQGHHTRQAVMEGRTDRGLDLIIPHHAKAASPACALAILEGDAPPGAQQPTGRHPHCVGITSCTEHWVECKLQCWLGIVQSTCQLLKQLVPIAVLLVSLNFLACSNLWSVDADLQKGKEKLSNGNREGENMRAMQNGG